LGHPARARFAFFAALFMAAPLGSGGLPVATAGASAAPVLASAAPRALVQGATDAPAPGVPALALPAPEPIAWATVAAPLMDRPARRVSDRPTPPATTERAEDAEGSLPAVLAALLLIGWIVGRRRG